MSGRSHSKSALGVALAACFGVAALAAPASAEGDVEFNFSFARSKLETEAGAAEVYQSLKTQASRACEYVVVGLLVPEVDKDCVDDIVARVVASIDSPLLTAQHDGSAAYAVAQAESE